MRVLFCASIFLAVALAFVLSTGLHGKGQYKIPQIAQTNQFEIPADSEPLGDCSVSKCPMEDTCYKKGCYRTCSSDYDCDELDDSCCGHGICTSECSTSATCPPGQSCLKGVCQFDCSDSVTCPGQQVCVNGICQTCFDDDQCDDICHDGVCTNSCTQDRPCPNGQVCFQRGQGVCLYLCEGDYDCPGPLDCGVDTCGAYCDQDYLCQQNETCSDEVCLPNCQPPTYECPMTGQQFCGADGVCGASSF